MFMYTLQGNALYEEKQEFHKGFPRSDKVCHPSLFKMSDMGAPTYWRLSRLNSQMTTGNLVASK